MRLSDAQTRALAWRLAARQIADTEAWLSWEDLPELDDDSFRRLNDSMGDVAKSIRHVNAMHDKQSGIDSAALEEAAR